MACWLKNFFVAQALYLICYPAVSVKSMNASRRVYVVHSF